MTALDRRIVEEIVSAACRAPSVHNSQPWRWAHDGHQLNLYADWSRQLHHGDPHRRDLEISCGAALHHAVIAAAGAGYRTHVHRLPSPDDATHLASLTFRETEHRPSAETLARAIYQRYTDRRTPSSAPVPRRWVKDLVALGQERGAFVVPLRERDDHALVKDLRQLAEILQHDDEEYVAELGAWTHSRRDDGVPDGSVLAPPLRPGQSADSRFPAGVLRDKPSTEDPAPTWLVVATSSDDSLSRLRAGEALSAMLLHATMHDLAVVPYTQAVEIDATRERLEERLLAGGRSVQLILRVAVPPPGRARIPMTRRRALAEVLVIRQPQEVGIA